MSWTQPICDPCFSTQEPSRDPVRLQPHAREVERCCMCGRDTLSGIYVRRDPSKVPYPLR
jgi:hypothetical protein